MSDKESLSQSETAPSMERFIWSRLNKQQVGAYVEYFVKMELTMYGFQVYSTEVDDRGIDFVARHERGSFIEVQVKSLRGKGYVFMQKTKFALSDSLYLALGILTERKEPCLYLIPSRIWESVSTTFVSRDYGGDLKSKPEWGVNISGKNLATLAPFHFPNSVSRIIQSSM
jgi:hypothetical protein